MLWLMAEDPNYSQRLNHPRSKLYFKALKAIRHPQDSKQEDRSGRHHNSAFLKGSIICPAEHYHVADVRDVRYKAVADKLNDSHEFEVENQESKKEEWLRGEEGDKIAKHPKITRGGTKAKTEWHARFGAGKTELGVCKVEDKVESTKAETVQLAKVSAEERKANASPLREKGISTVSQAFLKAEKRENISMDESLWNHSIGKELEQLVAKERSLAASHGFKEL